jgi:hypothetical protein
MTLRSAIRANGDNAIFWGGVFDRAISKPTAQRHQAWLKKMLSTLSDPSINVGSGLESVSSYPS